MPILFPVSKRSQESCLGAPLSPTHKPWTPDRQIEIKGRDLLQHIVQKITLVWASHLIKPGSGIRRPSVSDLRVSGADTLFPYLPPRG